MRADARGGGNASLFSLGGIRMKRITLGEVLDRADKLKHDNRYDTETKISWISRLEMLIADEIIRKHEGGENFRFDGYDKDTAMDTELIVPEPYADIYVHWIHSKIDLFNQDYERYNNSASAYYAEYQSFAAYYNRENMPVQNKIKVF